MHACVRVKDECKRIQLSQRSHVGAETLLRDNSCCVVQDVAWREKVGIMHLRVCDKQGVAENLEQNLSLVQHVGSRLL